MSLVVVKGLPMSKLKPLKKGSFMKKSLKVLIASSALILAGTLLAGCEEKVPVSQIHEHTFSEEWSSNDGSHWHAATCEHSDLMKDVKAHTFGAWKEDKAATETEEGSQSRICSECGYVQHAAIAKLAHVHVFDETKYESDDDNHWHKATCHPEIITGVTKHTYGEWTVTVDPTETTKGQKERTCSVCQHVQKAEVNESLHVHTFEEAWQSDDSNHWHKASCGHNEVYGSFAPHDFGNPVVVNSTETVEGTKTYTCATCGYVKVEKLPLAPHTHTFADEFSHDEEYHWRAATCGHDVVDSKEGHSFSAWIDVANSVSAEYPNGKQQRQCSECYYIQYRAKAHEHSLSGWKSDADTHWKTCISGGCNEAEGHVFEEAAHTWKNNRVTSDWNNPVECSVCGYIKSNAWKNATETLPTDRYITIPASTYLSFTFSLMQKTRPYFYIRCANTEYNNNLYFYLYRINDNGSGLQLVSGYLKDKYASQSGRAVDETSNYVFVLRNTTNEPFDVLVHNATASYADATKIGTKTFTVNGVSAAYTMYKYTGNLGNTNVLYSIEDADGEEVYTISNPYMASAPSNFRDGYLYWYDQNGSYREANLPMYIYRSSAVTDRIYNYSYDTSTKAVIVYPMENAIFNAYKNDDWLKRMNNDSNYYYDSSTPVPEKYTELDLRFVAWFLYQWVRINDAQWSYDPTSGKISSPIYGADASLLFGASSNYSKAYIGTHASEMTLDPASLDYRYKKTSANGVENYILKVTNEASNDGKYSRFKMYYNTTTGGFYSDLGSSSNLTIFDTNFDRVTDHYFCTSSTSYDYWGRRYTYNHPEDFFEIEPGETYYFVVSTTYCATSAYTYAIEQTKFCLTLDAGDLGGDDGLTPIVAKDYTMVNQSIYGDKLYDLAVSNWEIPDNKLLVGFHDDDDNFILASNVNDYFYDVEEDVTLYADWIDAANVVAIPRNIYRWDDDWSIGIWAWFAPARTMSIDDAVTFHYVDGTTEEYLIYDDGGIAGLDDDDYAWVYFYDLPIEDRRDELLYIEMKQEFTLTANADGSGVCAPGCGDFDYSVDKGDAAELELFKDMFEDGYDLLKDCGGQDSYKYYFAGWGGGRNDASDVIVYDGGSYTPIRDETLTAIFKESADSGMVCLGNGSGDGENEGSYVEGGYEFKFSAIMDGYIELTILDPNLTIKGDGETMLTLRFSDGTTKTVGTVDIRTASGGNLNAGATRANGVILIKLFASVTQAEIANAVQIYVA